MSLKSTIIFIGLASVLMISSAWAGGKSFDKKGGGKASKNQIQEEPVVIEEEILIDQGLEVVEEDLTIEESLSDIVEEVVVKVDEEVVYKSQLCPNSTTLEELGLCIRRYIPRKYSNEFRFPEKSELFLLSDTISKMYNHECHTGILDSSLSQNLEVIQFVDQVTKQNFCVLMEYRDEDDSGRVDWGWGTVIVNMNPEKNLDLQVPHPIFDGGTLEQGFSLIKSVGAKSLIIAGTHRKASTSESTCQSGYFETDVAHNVGSLFDLTTDILIEKSIDDEVEPNVIQFHKMGSTSCEGTDIYLSYGVRDEYPKDMMIYNIIDNLKFNFPEWSVQYPESEIYCSKHGTKNIQGRMLNGVDASLCEDKADFYEGNFIHIEQKAGVQFPENWVKVLRDSIPNI